MSSEASPSDLTFRLPKEVRPVHYDLFLHPDLEKGTFKGTVTITIDIADRRSHIALHQKDLEITAASLKTYDPEESFNSGIDVPIKEYYTVEKLEELLVTFNEDLSPGSYNLTFEFKGALQPDKIVGFYSSTYKDVDNRTRYLRISHGNFSSL